MRRLDALKPSSELQFPNDSHGRHRDVMAAEKQTRWQAVVAIAVLAAIASFAVSAILVHHASPIAATTPPSASSGAGGSFEGIDIGRPFVNGVRFDSIDQASAKTGVNLTSLPRPADADASDSSIADVWVDNSSDQLMVRIDYTNGVYVQLEPAPDAFKSAAAAKQRYQEMAKEDATSTQGLAQVVTVGSTPGYLIPEDAAILANGESQGSAGMLTFVSDGQTVTVVGHLPDDDLIRIGASFPEA